MNGRSETDTVERNRPVRAPRTKERRASILALRSVLEMSPQACAHDEVVWQSQRYGALISSGDWHGLETQALRDRSIADRLSKQYRRTQNVTNTALRRMEAHSALVGDAPARKINTLPEWPALREAVIQQAVAQGLDPSKVNSAVRRFGQIDVSRNLADLKGAVDAHVPYLVRTSNDNLRLNLRRYAGVLLASAVASINVPEGGAAAAQSQTCPDAAGEATNLEERVYDALQSGATTTELVRLAADLRLAGESWMRAALAHHAGTAPGTEDRLTATVSILGAMDAALLGRFLEGRLGWARTEDRGTVVAPQRTRLQFNVDAPDASLVPGKFTARRAQAQGKVETVTYDESRTEIRIRSLGGRASRVFLPWTDAAAMGVVPGAYLRVYGLRSHQLAQSPNDRFIETLPRTHRHVDWREAVRHELRRSYLGVPFGLRAAWSWEPGPKGIAMMLDKCAWFT